MLRSLKKGGNIMNAKQDIQRAINCISTIYVRGQDAKLMAMALQSLENALNALPDADEKEEESNG